MSCLFHSCTSKKKNHDSEITVKLSKQRELFEQNTMRVLFLGISNSGKTTILKQIKRMNDKHSTIHLNNRRNVTKVIQSAVIEYMQILCEQSDILHKQHQQNTAINVKTTYLARDILALQSPFTLTPDIAFKIDSLWRDKGIKETWNKRCYFQIDDNVDHFFDKIKEISDSAYLPDFNDYLKLRQTTVGFERTTVALGDGLCLSNFEFIDVKGQRCERRKWMQFISGDFAAVVYVLSISDYDLRLFEDNETNCLIEAINVFRDIMIKANGFKDRKLVILFNKFDVFKKKIKKVPITVVFNDFPLNKMDPNDETDVIRFIAGKLYSVFEESNIERTSALQIIRTNAIDGDHIEKVVVDMMINLVKEKMKKNEDNDH